MRNTLTFIAIIVILYIPLALLDCSHFPYSDGAEHGSAVRELAKNTTDPDDPMIANHPENSPRFVPSTFLMALFMKLLDLDVLVVLKIFLIVFFILFLISAALFTQEYFNDPGQALWSIIALLFLWGLGWTGANAYMFSAIVYTSYFPSVVSFSLSLLACYFQLRFLHYGKTVALILYLLLGSLAFVNHPLTGVFFLICSCLLVAEKRGFTKKTVLHYFLLATVIFSLTSLWPYYSFYSNLLKILTGEMAKTTDYQLTRHYLYSEFFIRSGLALVGIPFVILLSLQKRYLLLVGGFVFFAFFYLAGYIFKISLAERFVFFIMFNMQLSVSRICREWFLQSIPAPHQHAKRITAWFLLLFLITGIGIQLVLVYTKFISPAFERTAGFTFPKYVSPNTMQMELKEYLGDGDVVLSDIYSSWSIPVYTGAKVIALFHTPPHVDDNLERINDVETFYHRDTTSEARTRIIKKYGITHILLNFRTAGREIEPILKKMGIPIIARGKSFCLFSVSTNNTK